MKRKIAIFSVCILLLASCGEDAKNNIKVLDNSTNIQVEKNKQTLNIVSVSLSEFKQELSKKDGIIIDLRTTPELEDSGIISGAIQMDFYASDFKDKINALDKSKKYLVYCRSGGRSGKTLRIMRNAGFKNVFELRGGMNSWLSNGEQTEIFPKEEGKKENIVILNAKKWEYSQKIIRVKKGEKLKIKVNNIDTLHGIAIPEMQLVGDSEIEVDTSKIGEFEFRCANYCGEGHQDMVGKIIIE